MPQPGRKDENIIAFKEKRDQARRAAMPKPDPEEDRRRARTNVAALILAAILVLVGWFLVRQLGQSARMQDCIMSGRSNCAPIETPARN
jgi:ferric-dicitrate binding protein FerR (iron transport regulator)